MLEYLANLMIPCPARLHAELLPTTRFASVHHMNLTKLKYLVTVDRQGSITAAAQALHITQSAITKAVADVEDELGYTVFDRHARGVTATAEGRTFIDRAARILSDMDQLVHDAQTGREIREQVLRLGVSPPTVEGLMNRAIEHLVLNHPDIRVQMRGTSLESGVQLLRQGDIDALVAPEKAVSADRDLISDALPPMSARLFVRKGHPLLKKGGGTASDIAKFPIITPDLTGPYAEPLMVLLEQLGGDPTRRLHVLEHFPTIASIIEKGDAVAVAIESYTRTQAFRRRFDVLEFDLGPPMAIAYRRQWRPSRANRWLQAALKAHPPTG